MSTATMEQLREQIDEAHAELDSLRRQIKQTLEITGNTSLADLVHEVLALRHERERDRPIFEKVRELDRLRIEIETEAMLKSTDTEKLTELRMRRTRLERELREALQAWPVEEGVNSR